MSALLAVLISVPSSLMAALVCLPHSTANLRVVAVRKWVTLLAAFQFMVSVGFALAFVSGWLPKLHVELDLVSRDLPIALTIYYDGVTSLMLMLVSFVGWVICQYSVRYLDGDVNQGRYFRWASFTIGAVSLMVLSGNLLMFIVAWVMTSLGLHQLLLHYGHRPAARRAAWTKFVISRLGDAALIAAMSVFYEQFKTLDFAELFAQAAAGSANTTAMQVAGFLLVIGAITKSAQFPFHTWLPQTMETPTPVSALMHAGIVNAGGYLMIRTSPLIACAPWAMTALAIVGGLTACFAATVMLTQTSIKKSLAYSTIAQMGFMLLQCGLGAFSSAMLHILAHSLYKAYAFLSSGSVVAERSATQGGLMSTSRPHWRTLAVVGVCVIAMQSAAFFAFGIQPVNKPGGLLLAGVLCVALTYWVGQVMQTENSQLITRAFIVAGGLCLLYCVSFVIVDRTIAPSLPTANPESFWLVSCLLIFGFGGLFGLHTALDSKRGVARLNRWYIHASNGFYIESVLRRVFGPKLSS